MADRVFVAGHNGMVGGAILRQLHAASVETITRSRPDLDLTDQVAVQTFFKTEKPNAVILAAAKVGGILANDSFPADFLYENLMIEANVIHAAYQAGVDRLLFLGSSCIYPRMAPQPINEDALLTGTLEPTNEPYAIAKITGIKLCESYARQHGCDFRSVMPTNLYGPGDNFHPEGSHVIPGMMRRFHEAARSGAKDVTVWGTGTPRREFLHVEDMAAGSLHVFNMDKTSYDAATDPRLSHINIGTGEDIAIGDLARMMAEVTGFKGDLVFDTSKPDGTPRKLLDTSKITSMGWAPKIALNDGLAETYDWFLDNVV